MGIAMSLSLSTLVLLTTSLPALAQETGRVVMVDRIEPVIVTSSTPDSVRGDYHIDFASLDRDQDGYISREEARANPTLDREFDALDTQRSGRLDREQLKGWLHE